MKRFLAAIRFLTIFPVPGTWGTDAADLARSVSCFPWVGLLLGGLAAASAWLLGRWEVPPLVAAVLLVVGLIGVSGGLHLDGLSDAADGLLSARSRQRMLEIMKDSRIGPMGVVAILAVVLTKFAALASLETSPRWAVVLLMPLTGRAAMVLHMALLPYVRGQGLGTIFFGRSQALAAAGAVFVWAAATGGLFGLPGLAVCGIGVAVTLLLAGYVYHKIGGVTGDTLGAVCEILEAVPAVTLAVWPLPLVS